MTIEVKFLEPNGAPFPAGAALELLGDGKVLGTAKLDQNGVAAFDADTSNVKLLAVRSDGLGAAPAA